MRYRALVTDYDGTLARDGQVAPETLEALERLRKSGRRALLATGRTLSELRASFDRCDVFDLVVAENGALLFDPRDSSERLLCEPASEKLVETLRARTISPLNAGRAIVATREPNETAVLEAIRELGLELQIVLNKGAVMILPNGITKATGLVAALDALGLSPRNAVGIGDAQNDLAFLTLAEASVAVANALPVVKERADLVTRGSEGAGVVELIERLLHDDLAALDARLERHRPSVGEAPDGRPLTPRPTTAPSSSSH